LKGVQMTSGRCFVLRLHEGEVLHESIESFAREHGIRSAVVTAVGGAEDGSQIVMGPRDGHVLPVEPMLHTLQGQHEMGGSGTVFLDDSGLPILHMHASFGRDGRSVTGCVRAGVTVWLVMEVVLQELIGDGARRVIDPRTGFALLEVGEHDL